MTSTPPCGLPALQALLFVQPRPKPSPYALVSCFAGQNACPRLCLWMTAASSLTLAYSSSNTCSPWPPSTILIPAYIAMCPVYAIRYITMWPHLLVMCITYTPNWDPARFPTYQREPRWNILAQQPQHDRIRIKPI